MLGLVEALFEPAVDDEALATGGRSRSAANESLVAYRRRHRTDATLDALGDLLLADRDNPRSVRFQLDSLALDLHDLPDRFGPPGRAPPRSARRSIASRPVCRSGAGAGHDGLGPVGALVLAVRQPVLEVGDLAPGAAWFTERPRRATATPPPAAGDRPACRPARWTPTRDPLPTALPARRCRR